MNHHNLSFKAALLAVGVFGSATVSFAQSSSDVANSASNIQQQNVLDEIVVTARRKGERLQETPVAVTANDLISRGAQDITILAEIAPNLNISNTAAFSGSTLTAVVFLRGFGQTDFALTTEQGVDV